MRDLNWTIKLSEYITSCRKKPFVFGEFDCCLFASDGIKAITGNDFAIDFKKTGYKTALGAAKAVQPYGSLEGLVTHFLGPPMENKAFVQRGDVVIATLPIPNTAQPSDCVGLCLGVHFAFAQDIGLRFYHLKDIRSAWKVV
jgi:hypothetical protein